MKLYLKFQTFIFIGQPQLSSDFANSLRYAFLNIFINKTIIPLFIVYFNQREFKRANNADAQKCGGE